uniref:RRM domain-containing protein n=1 Tax=Chromera velia CCMP2878 TaxID=1169474 RepID=A0A0G4GFD1_9ALVE|eukprot:Cvel_21542.t1-p1 / transcript=Cvel_21542.t1 / gene=Cvel_21542 / organism=Chromera_velia_CCMP2878 / gene_product=RNA-binding protein 28, putative / transcript_product=RNA-binding protein 28, putative / location=Cvel_scaffold2030:17806-27245(-) / protein_length=939 / sequence_SO=supercontig / SO=protein_coding / is_pseudo=false
MVKEESSGRGVKGKGKWKGKEKLDASKAIRICNVPPDCTQTDLENALKELRILSKKPFTLKPRKSKSKPKPGQKAKTNYEVYLPTVQDAAKLFGFIDKNRTLPAKIGGKQTTISIVPQMLLLQSIEQTKQTGRVILRNIAFDAGEDEVEAVCSKVVKPTEVKIPRKDDDSSHRGFAFAQYENRRDAEKALKALQGIQLKGRTLKADWAIAKDVYQKAKDMEKGGDDEDEGKGKGQQEKGKSKGKRGLGDEDESSPVSKRQKKEKKEKEIVVKKEEDEEEEEDLEESEEEEDEEDGPRVKQEEGGEDDEDEEESEEEEEDEEEDEDDEEDEEEEDEVPKKKRKQERDHGHDVSEGRTLFVRNVPFDATDKDLLTAFQRFGKVLFAKTVRTSTGEAKGTAFVKFAKAAHAETVLKEEAAAETKIRELLGTRNKQSRAGAAKATIEGIGLQVKGRRVFCTPAVQPDKAATLSKEREVSKTKAKSMEKSRNLTLMMEGWVDPDSVEGRGMPDKDKKRRAAAMKEKKYRLTQNTNFFVNPLRLSIRNLPPKVPEGQVKRTIQALLRGENPVKAQGEGGGGGRADKGAERAQVPLAMLTAAVENPDTPEKKREALKELQRRMKREGLKTKLSKEDTRILGNLAATELKRVTLVSDLVRAKKVASGETSVMKSKGFSFAEFSTHEVALYVLRSLNNSKIFGDEMRPIVEFAVEDKRAVRVLQKRKDRFLGKQKEKEKDTKGGGEGDREGGDDEDGQEDSKGSSGLKLKKKPHQKSYSRGKRQREKKKMGQQETSSAAAEEGGEKGRARDSQTAAPSVAPSAPAKRMPSVAPRGRGGMQQQQFGRGGRGAGAGRGGRERGGEFRPSFESRGGSGGRGRGGGRGGGFQSSGEAPGGASRKRGAPEAGARPGDFEEAFARKRQKQWEESACSPQCKERSVCTSRATSIV